MSAKKAKALRKELKYHPKVVTLYEAINTVKTDTNGDKHNRITLELSAKCKRYQYQQAKKNG